MRYWYRSTFPSLHLYHLLSQVHWIIFLQVSQPPNTPSSLSLAQNNAVSAASETEFEVMDEERRVVNSNGRC